MSDKMKLKISGLHCDGCSNRVKTALESISGVTTASVDHNTGLAEINTPDGEADFNQLITAVENIGYTATRA